MFKVRAATPSDSHAVQEIFRTNIENAEWLPELARVSDFAKASEGELVFVASSSDGEVVGFVSVYVEDSFIHHLYVRSDFQNKGIGRSLLSSLQHWLPVPWRLKCVRKNQRALSFYLRNDWREVGVGESEDGAYVVLEWHRELTVS
ncbi:GNAT family N-acetyltransferase [Collimonas humicola]|uniref:GNAT family N-acetyltransferase n=1 Tax=Collimonas humicola TaxID=2825886 RepID=UPI001B8BBC92|nr:GNAT family N-acetyltransferase [Collimonas humicola]